ncbi:MAG TPA: hypothetical protein PK788_08605 [Gemmatimonadaceae bacterium]|nr:hypothetical protein [Gemmatimonadaceae bacterium]
MLTWAFALLLGVAVATLGYLGARPLPRGLVALRAFGATLVAALLLDAPMAPPRPLSPWVALDASASWGPDSARWLAAQRTAASALAAGADSLVIFGSALRAGALRPAMPTDPASRVGDVVELARAQGRPVVIVTDGRLDDLERLAELPLGSQLLLPAPETHPDVGLAPLVAPEGALIGDTVEIPVLLRANGVSGASARTLRLSVGGRELATAAVDALDANAERELRVRVVVPAVEGEQEIVAALDAADARRGNDSVRTTIVVSGAASVALVSTAPDQDARFALALLRQTQRGAVRGYWRVAPGQWREGGVLRPVSEEVVRRAVGSASLLVLHGDTAYFGPARARARAALVLMPSVGASEEYYATAAGDSPLRAALGDLPFDELPPLRVGSSARGLPALLARRARRTDERAVVTLRDADSRTVIVSAAGFWRWRTRGGRAAQSFDALWGSIFDWVSASTAARRGEDPSSALSRETLPRPVAAAGPVGTAPVVDLAPRARQAWWLAALALLAFSAEWILRRRIGWR